MARNIIGIQTERASGGHGVGGTKGAICAKSGLGSLVLQPWGRLLPVALGGGCCLWPWEEAAACGPGEEAVPVVTAVRSVNPSRGEA